LIPVDLHRRHGDIHRHIHAPQALGNGLPDSLLILGAAIAPGQAQGQQESGDDTHITIIPAGRVMAAGS
jgi:hypothetical protein